MLKSEQAKARLAEWQLPEEENRIAEGVQALPAVLREQARHLFRLDEDQDDADWETLGRRAREAAAQLDRSTAKDRAKIFGVIAPRLAPTMERAWQLLKTMPFQSGYTSKGFRAPHHPEIAISNITGWMKRMADLGRKFKPEILTPRWLAAWCPHLKEDYFGYDEEVGILLAAVLNEKSDEADEVFEILRQSLGNQHEIGAMGRHVCTALLLSERKGGWELMEKTLLAAQRQEGLRQAILESLDQAHPDAFLRMLRIILDQDLVRFSSVVRAVDVWFGELWAAASAGVVKKSLALAAEFLENPAARNKALKGKDAEAAYLALWCVATEDAYASIPLAETLLKSKSVELRYVAVQHLVNIKVGAAAVALIPALDDEDLRVAILALTAVAEEGEIREIAALKKDDRFERIERLVDRLPEKPQKLKPLVWPWTETEVKQSRVAACLLTTCGDRPVSRLTPHLAKLDTYGRCALVRKLAEAKTWDADCRQAIIALAGDASADVREEAFKALQDKKLAAAEVLRLEAYMTRKTGDLRRGVLALLLQQPDEAACASAARLLAAKDAQQRLAGLELLRLLVDTQRAVAECRRQADAFRTQRKKVSKEEQSHLAEIAKEKVTVATLADALGLMNRAERTPVVPPRKLKVSFITAAAGACVEALDALVHKHREENIRYEFFGDPREELLGNVSYSFPSPDTQKPRAGQEQNLPLAAVWQEWNSDRGKKYRDKDGLELVRALAWATMLESWDADDWKVWAKKSAAHKTVAETLSGGQPLRELKYGPVVKDVLGWLIFLSPPDATEYLLDALETSYALVPEAEMTLLTKFKKREKSRYYLPHDDEEQDWRDAKAFELWPEALSQHLRYSGNKLSPEQHVRFWRLMHWCDEPIAGARRRRVDCSLLMTVYAHGAATLADIADHLLAPRSEGKYSDESFSLLSSLTERQRDGQDGNWLTAHPEVKKLLDQAIERILELEFNRGDSPTAATEPAYALTSLRGIETLRRVLASLGKGEFKIARGWRDTAQDRRQTLTQLAKITFPYEDETPEDFGRLMKKAVQEGQFPEDRLLQLVFLAPQWTKCLEAYFGWEQMSEGVYWFLAHMRYISGLGENAAEAAGVEDSSSEDSETASTDTSDDEADDDKPEKLSAWERLILERTPLSDADRGEGAIDVAWFQRTHEKLGDQHWQALAAAARFATNASQAKRAQFIADVLLNKVSRKELVDGIKKKQLKEHVRLLGLLPLATGKKRDADLLERCQVLREYRRYANQLSGLTKPAALRAWEIGMKNLAQTAGFADPLRLEWSVGAEAVKDLAAGPVSVTKDGVKVTLSLDELSKPLISIQKGDKELKSIPPAIKKDKKVAELTGRVTDLKRQASAIRQSLESSMCRGDTFDGNELRTWCDHALLAPLLNRLVVLGDGIAGYPDKNGKALRDYRGKLEPVKPTETLRLAHPYDLFETKAWHEWQRECFQSERVQPFKQIFRELYVLTKQEQKDGKISRRYDGQQIQPKQSLALFGTRGWNTGDGIFKVFHDFGLTVSVGFQSGITTPLEVEGATLAGVSFARRDEWKPVRLSEVPPRLFSEVMRDLDLVVSVAHAGGVDPEASASTVEMRANLLRETCALLQLKNVKLKPNHAVIDGELANYSVHLGSGIVHRMPGGSLCIVPVHAQHRGRLFLPFADDDPRTAEIVSKVLLLARDQEIQDPIILEQIRR